MSKILGIDYGAKNIGLAMATLEERLAVPWVILENKSKKYVLRELEKIIKEEEIEKIVVGLPLSLKARGDSSEESRPRDFENEQMKTILRFIDYLKDNLSLPILTQDERLSSEEASKLLRDLGSKKNDAVAAMLILESWLGRKS